MKIFLYIFLWIKLAQANYDQCEEGWIGIDTSCYYISNYTLGWQIARQVCIQANSKLFIINSRQELDDLMAKIKAPSGVYFWVNRTNKLLRKIKNFIFIDWPK